MSVDAQKGKSLMLKDALGHVDGELSALFEPKDAQYFCKATCYSQCLVSMEPVCSTSDCAEYVRYGGRWPFCNYLVTSPFSRSSIRFSAF